MTLLTIDTPTGIPARLRETIEEAGEEIVAEAATKLAKEYKQRLERAKADG